MQVIKWVEEAPGPTAVKQKLQLDTSGWIMLFKAPSQMETRIQAHLNTINEGIIQQYVAVAPKRTVLLF